MSYVWPIKGNVTQGFGRPALKVEPTMWLAKDESRCRPTKFPGAVLYQDVHPGIDIACAELAPVLAPADGKVVRNTVYRIFNPLTDSYVYGRYAQLRFGAYLLHVDHLAKALKEGSKVEAGQAWAWVGSGGISTGTHAHVEVRATVNPSASWDGYRLNPVRFLKGD